MPQIQEQRHIYYDNDLKIEAYNLTGIVQKFPNHFHEFYVIGFIEGGSRHLGCKGMEYDLSSGDLILFNPRDNHFCAPNNDEILDYRAININTEIMEKAVKDITGKKFTPHFTQNVVEKCEIALSIKTLYEAIVGHASKMEKEEVFLLLIEQILLEYTSPFEQADIKQPNCKIKMLCNYMEERFSENITLDDLASKAQLSKYYLLRSFTKQIGVSPYRYLQSIRIEKSKRLLEQGILPIDAASETGFTDQSHFTNYFKDFIGLTPKQYQRIFIDSSINKFNDKTEVFTYDK